LLLKIDIVDLGVGLGVEFYGLGLALVLEILVMFASLVLAIA